MRKIRQFFLTTAESPQSGRRSHNGLFKSKAMKCLLTFVFATLIVGQTWAQTYVVNGTTQYTVIDETNHYVSIFEGNRNISGSITIAERVYLNGAYYQVTAIANEGFKDCANITSITIPNTITSIGYDAFSGCSSLDKAVFSSIESFFGISYGNDLSNPLYYAKHFYTGGTEVINLVIPDGVTSIADYAFYKCSSLVSVSIPESVTSIGKYAFSGCKGLTEVTVPNSVTWIGISAFGGCSGLTKITLPFVGNRPHAPTDNYQYPFGYIFGESSYTGGTKTEQNYYGSSTSSTTGAHYYIPTSLKEVVITGSSYIPYAAFENCWNLTSVTIPNSVTSIGGFAFYRCGSLAEITIPNSVTSIGNAAFNNCISLTEITIPNSVTSIGNSAFYNCSGLTSVAISNSVTMIGTNTFYGCWSLREVTIPNSVTSIGNSAFYGCSNLTSIVIPQNITRVWDDAFANCTRLTSVTVNSETVDLSNSGLCFTKDGIRYAVLNKYNVMVAANSCANNVTIPTSVTSGNSFSITGIAADAFKDCTTLSTINIPTNVTSVGANAFSGCTGLTSIIITSNADFSKSGLQFTKDDNKYLVLSKSVARIITTPGNGTMPATVTFGNEFTVTGIVPTEPNMVGDVYQIATAGNLYWFARNVNSGGWDIKGILTADIVVNENVLNENGTLNGDGSLFMPWTPIGTSASKFKGSFDGNYHTISGLYFNNTTNNSYANGGGNNVGLIGYANGATIKNVGVIDSYIRGNTYVGGICGIGGTQTNCYNTGTVSGSGNTLSEGRYVGGICGSGGTQTNCFNTGKVSGGNYVGGICGNGGSQTQCYYLASCGSKNTYGVSATENEFASGKIAYLLNGSTSQGTLTWYQTIGEDKHPLFDNSHGMVFASTPCPYSNNSNGILEHNHIDGFCICGDAEQPNSVDGVYQIANAGHLYWFAAHVNSGNTTDNAVLTADIVVNSNVLNSNGSLNGNGSSFMTWTPIGTSSYIYEGTFDGNNGHTISGLYFNNTTNSNYPDGGNYVGLIGYANGATIKDVGVTDSYLYGYKFTGGICGYGYNTNITNCYNTGRVSGSNNYVGGISGCRGTITNCYNTGTVSGTSSNSYYVGGICGSNGTQTNCYNTGTVSSSGNCVGGICGDQGTQNKCHNAGKVSGSNNYVGGICGNQGSQTNCYNIETVSGKSYVGGISGYQGTQTNCYDTGTVSGSSYYGCICGGRGGTQTNCYSLVTLSSSGGTDGAYYSAGAFASGQVAYKLNDSDFNGTTWRQTLYSDATPVFDESHNAVTGYTSQSYNVITVTGDLVVATNYEVAEGKTLKIPAGASVTTTDDAVITNNGTIICNGTIAGNDLEGNGSFVYDQIAENDITLSAESVPYKGSAYTIGNGIEVSYTNRTMCDKTFIFGGSIAEPTYENNITPGTATIHWGNTVSKQFTILPLTVSSPTITLSQTSFTYNGSAIEPTVTVKNGETTIDPSEYTVSYSNNTNAGTSATVTITDKDGGNYTVSSVSATFTINPKVVSSPTIELSATSFTYNGSAQTPTVTVKDGETTIASGEYTVSYSSNTNAGTTATVTITDKANGNYTVSNCSATFTISPKVVSNPTIELSATEFTYNGSAQTPTVTVKDGSTTIASGEYTVSYSNNTNAGTATVTIADKANGNYTVSGSATFTISPKVVSNPTIELSQTSYTYDGSAKTPTVSSVKDGSTIIASGEYTVSYSNNTNAGTATVTIADMANGNYTVSGSATFTISPKEVSNPTIELSQTSYTYDGSAKTPTVSSVKDGSTIIASGEYTVSYSNNTNAGTATVTIADKANGNYTVSGSTTFTISPKEVSSPTIEFSDAEITYTGSALTPTITVKDGSTVIPTSEYTVGYSNNTNAGTANLTITDKANGNYTVSGETTFTINPKTVSNPTIILSQTTFIYDGTAKSPTVTSVKDGSTVIPTSEYTVTMPDDAVSVGDYTVEIEDIDGGNYNVSGSTTFTINLCTEHQFDNFGQCTVCGEYTQPELVDGVYQIASAAHLYWFASWVNKGNAEASAVLTADIVVNSNVLAADGSLNGDGSNFRTWTPIGFYDAEEYIEYAFSGTFDGNNHTISGLYSVGYEYCVGLFGIATEATIKNVGIVDSYFSGIECIGGVCGYAQNNCTIDNCYNIGTINSEEVSAGGICGSAYYNCTITNCYNTGAVDCGIAYAGGICGYMEINSTITNCYNTGKVTCGEECAGGICGWAQDNCTITNCYNTGAVSSEYGAGGICGFLTGSEITNCYNTGAVTCGESYAGGICGYLDESTATNNFYLAGCATVGEGENVVVQNGVGVDEGEEPAADAEGQTTAATASEFASGHIAYLLNGSEFGGSVWHQTLFADEAPVLNAEHNSVTGYITEEGSVVTVVGSVVVESAYEVANGKTLNIPANATLTTTGDGVITNNGTIVLNGTLAGNDLAGSGNFIYGGQIATADLVLSNANYVYKGSAYDDIEFTVSRTICGKVFTYGDAYTVSYANNINAGQATISLTNNNDAENVVSSHFTIKPVEDEVVVTVTLADKSVVFSGAAQTYNSEDALTIEANNALYNISWVSASGNAASVSGTNAAEYAFGWNAEMFSNTSDNFTNVRFDVTDGKLIITPNTEVVVTVTENSSTLTYNGEEQSVSGYSVAISDATGVYTEDDIAFSGTATASGINAGVYQMQLSADDFSNTNENFAEVTFNIVDGALTISKAAEAPNKPAAAMETRYINTQLVALPADWAWSGNKALELGDNTATANYAGADKGNYEVESVAVTIKRLPCLHNEGNELLYTLEPTCTHKGYSGNLSCSLCGEIYEMGDSIPALGHIYDTVAVAATCTTEGCDQLTCSRCGDVTRINIVPANGHKADSVVFVNVVTATCTTAGSYDSVTYCTVCNTEISHETIVVAALGHTAGEPVVENFVAPTCTEAGAVDSVVYCTVDNAELNRVHQVIPALGHEAGRKVAENYVASTTTTEGSVDSVVYCTRCKVEISRETFVIPVSDHEHIAGEPVVENFVAPTCTEAGSVDTAVYCTVNGELLSLKTTVLPALGHKADSVVKENVVNATFEAAGSYELVTYCSVCGAEISREKVEVPQLVKPVEAEVVEIVISKLEYTVGDSLKLDGGKLVIATSDSTTAEVVITSEMISGFNSDSVGVQTVTVAFEIDGVAYTTTFDVEVKEAEVIEVVAKSVALSAPVKITYKKGEALDVAGGKLTVTYSNGTTQDVELKADMVSGFDADKVGAQQLTVTLTVDKVVLTASFDVTVEADDDTAISDDEAAAVNIYAYQNVIVVESADAHESEISIFDVNGRMVAKELAAGSRTEIMMQQQGIYIVKVNNTAKRVMVY